MSFFSPPCVRMCEILRSSPPAKCIDIVTGIRHLPYEERLQRRRLQADLVIAFKIFTGLLGVDPNLPYRPPIRRGFRGYSKVRAIAEGEDREILE